MKRFLAITVLLVAIAAFLTFASLQAQPTNVTVVNIFDRLAYTHLVRSDTTARSDTSLTFLVPYSQYLEVQTYTHHTDSASIYTFVQYKRGDVWTVVKRDTLTFGDSSSPTLATGAARSFVLRSPSTDLLSGAWLWRVINIMHPYDSASDKGGATYSQYYITH